MVGGFGIAGGGGLAGLGRVCGIAERDVDEFHCQFRARGICGVVAGVGAGFVSGLRIETDDLLDPVQGRQPGLNLHEGTHRGPDRHDQQEQIKDKGHQVAQLHRTVGHPDAADGEHHQKGRL